MPGQCCSCRGLASAAANAAEGNSAAAAAAAAAIAAAAAPAAAAVAADAAAHAAAHPSGSRKEPAPGKPHARASRAVSARLCCDARSSRDLN